MRDSSEKMFVKRLHDELLGCLCGGQNRYKSIYIRTRYMKCWSISHVRSRCQTVVRILRKVYLQVMTSQGGSHIEVNPESVRGRHNFRPDTLGQSQWA